MFLLQIQKVSMVIWVKFSDPEFFKFPIRLLHFFRRLAQHGAALRLHQEVGAEGQGAKSGCSGSQRLVGAHLKFNALVCPRAEAPFLWGTYLNSACTSLAPVGSGRSRAAQKSVSGTMKKINTTTAFDLAPIRFWFHHRAAAREKRAINFRLLFAPGVTTHARFILGECILYTTNLLHSIFI